MSWRTLELALLLLAVSANLLKGSPLTDADFDVAIDDDGSEGFTTSNTDVRAKRAAKAESGAKSAGAKEGEYPDLDGPSKADSCKPLGTVESSVALSIGGVKAGNLNLDTMVDPLKEGVNTALEVGKDSQIKLDAHAKRIKHLLSLSLTHDSKLADLLKGVQDRASEVNAVDKKADEIRQELEQKKRDLEAQKSKQAQDTKEGKAAQAALQTKLEQEVANRETKLNDLKTEADGKITNLKTAMKNIESALADERKKRDQLEKDLKANKGETQKNKNNLALTVVAIDILGEALAYANSERVALKASLEDLWEVVVGMNKKFESFKKEITAEVEQLRLDFAQGLVGLAENLYGGPVPARATAAANAKGPDVEKLKREMTMTIIQYMHLKPNGKPVGDVAKLTQVTKQHWFLSMICSAFGMRSLWSMFWCYWTGCKPAERKVAVYEAATQASAKAPAAKDGKGTEPTAATVEIIVEEFVANNVVALPNGQYGIKQTQ